MASTNAMQAYASAGGTVSSSALELTDAPFSFSDAQLKKADFCWISCDTNPIRLRYDGTAPTTSSGFYLESGRLFFVEGQQNISKLQFIAVSTDASVFVILESYNPDGI